MSWANTENYCLWYFQGFWKRCPGEVINCFLKSMSMNIRFAAKTNWIAHNIMDKAHWRCFSVFFFQYIPMIWMFLNSSSLSSTLYLIPNFHSYWNNWGKILEIASPNQLRVCYSAFDHVFLQIFIFETWINLDPDLRHKNPCKEHLSFRSQSFSVLMTLYTALYKKMFWKNGFWPGI